MSELTIAQQRVMDQINQQIAILIDVIGKESLSPERRTEYIRLNLENLEDLYQNLCGCIPIGLSSFKHMADVPSLHNTLRYVLDQLQIKVYDETYIQMIQSFDQQDTPVDEDVNVERVQALVLRLESLMHSIPKHRQADLKGVVDYARGLAEYYRTHKTH